MSRKPRPRKPRSPTYPPVPARRPAVGFRVDAAPSVAATIAGLAVAILAAVAMVAVLSGAEAAVTLGLAGWLPVAVLAIFAGGGGPGLRRRMLRGRGFAAVLPLLPLAVGVALASGHSL